MKWSALALVAIFGIYTLWVLNAPKPPRDAAELLNSETLRQVVTDRFVTQVVVQSDFGDALLGPDDVFAFGKVSLLIGIDLQKMDIANGKDGAPQLFVSLPDAEILSVELNEDSVRFIRKASALQRLRDIDGTEQHKQIRVKLREAARQFVTAEGLLPTREQMKQRVIMILRDADIPTNGVIFVETTN